MDKPKNDLLQGTLALLVLKTVARGPQHGYVNTKTFNFFNGRTWSHVALPRPLLPALSRLRTAQKHLSRCTKIGRAHV